MLKTETRKIKYLKEVEKSQKLTNIFYESDSFVSKFGKPILLIQNLDLVS